MESPTLEVNRPLRPAALLRILSVFAWMALTACGGGGTNGNSPNGGGNANVWTP